MWQRSHSRLVYLSHRILAMIEHSSLDRIRLLRTKGSGHAISKNHCNLGVGRGDRLFNICI
jgi:hypothetical protein